MGDTPFGYGAQTGYCHAHGIQSQCQRFTMKVAACQNLSVFCKNERIVSYGICFNLQDAADMPQNIKARAQNLWLAANRIRILYTVAINVRRADVTAGQKVPQCRGDVDDE